MRFTAKGEVVYAIALGWPTKTLSIKSLGTEAKLLDKPIEVIQLLGSDEKIRWTQGQDSLTIEPVQNKPDGIAAVFKVTLN